MGRGYSLESFIEFYTNYSLTSSSSLLIIYFLFLRELLNFYLFDRFLIICSLNFKILLSFDSSALL